MKREQIQLILACSLILMGIGSLISGIAIEPVGEIHSSILIAFGEILTFVGGLFGIDYQYKFRK